jgi:hypothetical protein
MLPNMQLIQFKVGDGRMNLLFFFGWTGGIQEEFWWISLVWCGLAISKQAFILWLVFR